MLQDKIAPSILAADFANFASELARIEETDAEYVHIDIMDGHFVPNITFGADVVAAMRKHSRLFFDCHLMVENPEQHIASFARAGADSVTIHVEATPHIHGALQQIKANGMQASVAVNPGTPVSAVEPVLGMVDQVLVMTVNPGFGGQRFLPETIEKVEQLARMRQTKGLSFAIEVDGGIDDQTIGQAKAAGANVFVAGSYLFKGDLKERVTLLREGLHV